MREDIIRYISWERKEYYDFTTLMEMMKGSGKEETNLEICLDNVRKADVYILLFGKRYGSSPESLLKGKEFTNTDNKSFTEFEYDCALETYQFKRYRYYHIEVSEEYIKHCNSGDSFSDLTDPRRNAGYERFKKKLDRSNGNIVVNSYADLQRELNTILSNTRDEYQSILELGIMEHHQIAINRTSQTAYLQQQARYLTDGNEDENGKRRSKIISFIVKSRNELNSDNDKLLLFTKRARSILSNSANISKNIVDLNEVQSIDDKRVFSDFLKLHVNSYLKGNDPSMYPVEKFISDVKSDKVQNEFWSFGIDARLGLEQVEPGIKKLTHFLNTLNNELLQSEFYYKIYTFLFLISPDATADIDTKDFSFEYKKFDQYLADITLADIDEWFDFLLQDKSKEFADSFDVAKKQQVINQIFLDRNSFPKNYRECLDNIKERTK